MKTKGERIKETASKLIELLKVEGFVIQYYEAYSTNSIYIKLDYGVCNSIRISDHNGYNHLHYRYTILLDQKQQITKRAPQGWPEYIYPAKDLKNLVKHIVNSRNLKQRNLGNRHEYEHKMLKAKESNLGKSGFWSKAKLLEGTTA